jgi:hypothetical protein
MGQRSGCLRQPTGHSAVDSPRCVRWVGAAGGHRSESPQVPIDSFSFTPELSRRPVRRSRAREGRRGCRRPTNYPNGRGCEVSGVRHRRRSGHRLPADIPRAPPASGQPRQVARPSAFPLGSVGDRREAVPRKRPRLFPVRDIVACALLLLGTPQRRRGDPPVDWQVFASLTNRHLVDRIHKPGSCRLPARLAATRCRCAGQWVF